MTIGRTSAAALVARLSLAHGGFAMLALDQRESLRDMFARAGYAPLAGDDTLRRFKRRAVAVLTPHASGVLLDRPLAVTTERPAGVAAGCGLILAADVLHHDRDRKITSTSLDPLVTPEFIARVGAVAVKLLVIWRAGRDQGQRGELVSAFSGLAREAGVASLRVPRRAGDLVRRHRGPRRDRGSAQPVGAPARPARRHRRAFDASAYVRECGEEG